MANKNYVGALDTTDPKEIEKMEYALFGKDVVDNWKKTQSKNNNKSPKLFSHV